MLGEKQDVTYLSARGKYITQRSDADDKNAEKVVLTDKNGDPVKTVYERKHTFVSGRITRLRRNDVSIAEKNMEFTQFEIHMQDGDEKYILQFPWKSNYTLSFWKMMENIDYKENVTIWAWVNDEGRGQLGAKQSGGTVKWFYNKENPSPAWVETKFDGKKVWDRTDEFEFFEDVINRINASLGATDDTPEEPKAEVTVASLSAKGGQLAFVEEFQEEWPKVAAQMNGFSTVDRMKVLLAWQEKINTIEKGWELTLDGQVNGDLPF